VIQQTSEEQQKLIDKYFVIRYTTCTNNNKYAYKLGKCTTLISKIRSVDHVIRVQFSHEIRITCPASIDRNKSATVLGQIVTTFWNKKTQQVCNSSWPDHNNILKYKNTTICNSSWPDRNNILKYKNTRFAWQISHFEIYVNN